MNLNQLRVFWAVSTEGSVTRAARSLSITQPAVSKQLAELEQTLGVTLFDRLPRGVRLTAAGQLLQRHARRIFATEAAAESEIAELKGLSRGQLSIGASTTIGSYLIPSLFGAFSRSHPRVQLALEIGNTAGIQAAVLDNRLHLGLTEGFVSSDQLEVEVVSHDHMVAIAAPTHPAASRVSMTAAELCSLPFIVRERGSGTRDVIEAALAERDIALAPLMSLGSTEAVKNAVASGLGVAIVPRLTVELELKARLLREIPLADLRIERALHLLWLKAKRPSPAVAAFSTLLRERLRDPVVRAPSYAI